MTKTILTNKHTIAVVSNAVDLDISYINANEFSAIQVVDVAEIDINHVETIIIDGLNTNNWKTHLNTIENAEVLEDIPVLLLCNTLETSFVKEMLNRNVFCCIQEIASPMTIMLLHTASQQYKKNKENTIKNNQLNRLLSTNYLMLDAKNQFFEQTKKHIEIFLEDDMKISKIALQKMRAGIEKHLKDEYQYQLFKVHFEEVHPMFYKKLLAINSDLTDTNLKLVSFIKMGFSNAEISFFLNISMSGVKKAIQRMKQKLEIAPENSLRKFIFNI
jgi:DNA-binding NarL/FixJ family response regulator